VPHRESGNEEDPGKQANPAVLEAIEKLRKLGFNPIFLSSEKYNMHQLRALRAISQAMFPRRKGITI